VRSSRFSNVAEAREMARRRLPRVVFDYIDGAADDEHTMHANLAAFDDVVFRPSMGMGNGRPDLRTSVLGISLDLPVICAPCGFVSIMHPDGAMAVARAAAAAGTVSVLSTVAGTPPEDVAHVAPGRMWFQLYAPPPIRENAEKLVTRVEGLGIGVLVVTVDTAELGNRERDRRNGVTLPLALRGASSLSLAAQILARPGWTARAISHMLATGKGGPAIPKMVASPFTWEDIGWLRGLWSGKLLVKGILTREDAIRAIGNGADGVVVSNHAGRQLEGAPASLHALVEVVDRVGRETEVLMDGGVCRGTHVLKALAVGAKAVMIGRPYLWGLAASGEPGVARILEVLGSEMLRDLILLGCPGVSLLDRSYIARREMPGL